MTTGVTGPALKEIIGEIDKLQAEPPTDKELKAFQNYRAGVFVLQNSSRPGIIGQLEFVDLHGLPADYLNGYVCDQGRLKGIKTPVNDAVVAAVRSHGVGKLKPDPKNLEPILKILPTS